jgi:hypothetical protein
MPDNPATFLLERARERISRDGHIKHCVHRSAEIAAVYGEPSGWCIIGALFLPAEDPAGEPVTDGEEAHAFLREARGPLLPRADYPDDVVGVNNHPDTTREEVLSWLDRAIDLSRDAEVEATR